LRGEGSAFVFNVDEKQIPRSVRDDTPFMAGK
jgi:hypothetical protein